jgi:DNA processing protein
VEAGLSSGSLITAECAAEQGRNIYALPGNINSMYSFGTNKLIKDGATPLIVFDDIIDELGMKRKSPSFILKSELGKDEKIIYDLILESGETTTDAICKAAANSPRNECDDNDFRDEGSAADSFGKNFYCKIKILCI